jgi:hypothetical protein
MKNIRILAALAALVITTSAALAQNDVYLHPERLAQETFQVQKVYFICNVTSGGIDSAFFGNGQSAGAHFRFMQGASFDYVWSQLKQQGLLKECRYSYSAARLVTQEARQQGLNALGSHETVLASDQGARDPAWIAACDYSFSVDKTDQGGSHSGWGQSRSGSESYISVTLSVTITCFPFGDQGEGITIRASSHRDFLLGKEVDVSDDGRPIFHFFRRSSDRDASTQTNSHIRHDRSATTILDEMGNEVFDFASEQLITKLPH